MYPWSYIHTGLYHWILIPTKKEKRKHFRTCLWFLSGFVDVYLQWTSEITISSGSVSPTEWYYTCLMSACYNWVMTQRRSTIIDSNPPPTVSLPRVSDLHNDQQYSISLTVLMLDWLIRHFKAVLVVDKDLIKPACILAHVASCGIL